MFSATANWTGVPADFRLLILGGLLVVGLVAICLASVLHDDEQTAPKAAGETGRTPATRATAAPSPSPIGAIADDDLGAPFRAVGTSVDPRITRRRPSVDWVTLADETTAAPAESAPAATTTADGEHLADATLVGTDSRSPAGVA
jgi:hypothetical protein